MRYNKNRNFRGSCWLSWLSKKSEIKRYRWNWRQSEKSQLENNDNRPRERSRLPWLRGVRYDIMRKSGTYCLSRYVTKSCLDLNFQESCCAVNVVRLRFLLSVSVLNYIRFKSVIIAKHAVDFLVKHAVCTHNAEPYGTAYLKKSCSDRKAPPAPCPGDPARKMTSWLI